MGWTIGPLLVYRTRNQRGNTHDYSPVRVHDKRTKTRSSKSIANVRMTSGDKT